MKTDESGRLHERKEKVTRVWKLFLISFVQLPPDSSVFSNEAPQTRSEARTETLKAFFPVERQPSFWVIKKPCRHSNR